MALNPDYIVGINLGEVFRDKLSGEPLANGKIYFYKDDDRLVGKDVYQLTGFPNYSYVGLPNPIILSDVGTIQNAGGDNVAVYYLPYDSLGNIENYYIVVTDENDVEQFTREAWPNLTEQTDPNNDFNGKVTNKLDNPQFAYTYFNTADTHLYKLTAESERLQIGPGWELVVTGSIGNTVSVTRNAFNGDSGVPSNPSSSYIVTPSYNLTIVPGAGITTCKLVQRLNHNPGIFSDGYVAGYMAVLASGVGQTISMKYEESDGSLVTNTICSGAINTSTWTEISGNLDLSASINSDSANTGYVDIVIESDVLNGFSITAVQITGTDQDDSIPPYDQQPVNRQEDLTWHAYKEQVVMYPKNSILTGWQFGVNPWQFSDSSPQDITQTALTGVYTADQTILVTENADMLNVGRSSGDDEGSLYITENTTPATQGRFAIVQYIDKETMRPYWGHYLSAMVRALMTTSNSTAIKYRVDFIYRSDAPPNTNPITAFGTTSTDNSYNTGWTAVHPLIDNVYTFSTSTVSGPANTYEPHVFERIKVPVCPSSTAYAALVVYTVDGALDTNDVLRIADVSLVPNEFAIAATPETFDESLRKCHYYYNKSFAQGTIPAQSVGIPNAEIGCQSVGINTTRTFSVQYPITMAITPTVTIYNPSAANAQIRDITNGVNYSSTTVVQNGARGFGVTAQTTAVGTSANTWAFHWSADARLG